MSKVSLFPKVCFIYFFSPSFSCFSAVPSRQHRVIFRFSSLLLIEILFTKTANLARPGAGLEEQPLSDGLPHSPSSSGGIPAAQEKR